MLIFNLIPKVSFKWAEKAKDLKIYVKLKMWNISGLRWVITWLGKTRTFHSGRVNLQASFFKVNILKIWDISISAVYNNNNRFRESRQMLNTEWSWYLGELFFLKERHHSKVGVHIWALEKIWKTLSCRHLETSGIQFRKIQQRTLKTFNNNWETYGF